MSDTVNESAISTKKDGVVSKSFSLVNASAEDFLKCSIDKKSTIKVSELNADCIVIDTDKLTLEIGE